jgi:hypothetical protein
LDTVEVVILRAVSSAHVVRTEDRGRFAELADQRALRRSVQGLTHYFGKPRQERTSHAKFETPWAGEPYVNIQNKNGQAKPYQVKQVLAAIDKLEGKE